MEEAELLKERLQAITNKKKIQEDIASKRLEIDREKLKLQHLKKKSMRDLWLLDGTGAGNGQEVQKAQKEAEQTKLLQSNIHRIEKEIEALEREELNISTNEGLILKRLKAIEKSTEDIIKAANANFKSEPTHIYSGTREPAKPSTSLNVRTQTVLDQDKKNEQHKPALLAMEINVQKDLRTGESCVLSASTVSTQELQQKGIKVYDDGRKSVYALRSDAGRPGANGVDELSPIEVEELLRKATERKERPQQGHDEASFSRGSTPSQPHMDDVPHHPCVNGYPDVSAWPELVYSDAGIRYPEQEVHHPAHMFHSYNDNPVGYYHARDGHHYRPEMYQEGSAYYEPRSETVHLDSDVSRRSPSLYSDDSRISVLNVIPSDEPVTMIFMGYQTADDVDDPQIYEGSVRAELVIIGEGEEEEEQRLHPQQNCNSNNAGPRLPSSDLTGSRTTQSIKARHKYCCVLM